MAAIGTAAAIMAAASALGARPALAGEGRPGSVCEPSGAGCTRAGSYPGPNALINGDYGGVATVIWTSSVVQPYSSGVPLYWTAYVTYTNTSSGDITLVCPAPGTGSGIAEIMSGGSGDDGLVPASNSFCDENPGEQQVIPPGGTTVDWATFHNVPWPGSTVALQWGDVGTSPSVTPFTLPAAEPYDTYAGYSAHPVSGYVMSEEATWVVPAVACPPYDYPYPPDTSAPRAGVWAGTWGSSDSINHKLAYLPQIGTTSDCNFIGSGTPHFSPGAHYSLVWEMASDVSGGGNAIHYGLDCPGTANFSLCGNLTKISAGDEVQAEVSFLGPYSDGSAIRTFEIQLTDLTSGEYALGTIRTLKPTKIADIASQGGAVVEGNKYGLADFATPVTFWHVYTQTAGGAGTTLRYNEYVMRSGRATPPQASDGPLAILDGGMAYSVSWLRQN